LKKFIPDILKEDNQLITVYNKDTGESVGTITQDQLQFLIDQLEEEHDKDQDYYINKDLLAVFEQKGIDPDLLTLLTTALGDQSSIEIEWKAEN